MEVSGDWDIHGRAAAGASGKFPAVVSLQCARPVLNGVIMVYFLRDGLESRILTEFLFSN